MRFRMNRWIFPYCDIGSVIVPISPERTFLNVHIYSHIRFIFIAHSTHKQKVHRLNTAHQIHSNNNAIKTDVYYPWITFVVAFINIHKYELDFAYTDFFQFDENFVDKDYYSFITFIAVRNGKREGGGGSVIVVVNRFFCCPLFLVFGKSRSIHTRTLEMKCVRAIV